MSIISDICKRGYYIKEDECLLSGTRLDIFKQDMKHKIFVDYNDIPIYICGDIKIMTKDHGDQLALNGMALKTNGVEIINDYYKLTPEEQCKRKNGYGFRTENYIQSCYKNIGFIRVKNGYEGEKFEYISTTHSYGINSSDVKVGKTKQGEWCCEYSYQTDIDDYNVETLYFSKFPTIDSFMTARMLIEIQVAFKQKRISEEYTCYECGRTVHWLDNNVSLHDKRQWMYEKYCGC